VSVVPQPLYAGWAGLASYRVPYADKTFHLKVAMGDPVNEPKSYGDLCRSAVAEGARASWASKRGLGPAICQIDPARGAIISDFVAGSSPTLEQAGGPLLPILVDAAAKLHSQDPSTLPEPGGSNWLLLYQKVGDNLAAAEAPRSKALQQGLLQLEAGLERYIERAAFVPVPLHDDFHPANTIWNGSTLTVLDWANLHPGDGATDVGHLATMADVSMPALEKSVVVPYLDNLKQYGAESAASTTSTARIKAYTTLFRLRNQAFYDQWPGSRPKADYLRHQLTLDVQGISTDVLAELGLRPSAELKR
jgi:hypothetical protein